MSLLSECYQGWTSALWRRVVWFGVLSVSHTNYAGFDGALCMHFFKPTHLQPLSCACLCLPLLLPLSPLLLHYRSMTPLWP
jgi:hypothetical protein